MDDASLRTTYLYLYLKGAFILHLVSMPMWILFILNTQVGSNIMVPLLMMAYFILVGPAFLIFQGMVAEKHWAVSQEFSFSNLKYQLFLGFTAGIGPAILFLRKYAPEMKEYLNGNG